MNYRLKQDDITYIFTHSDAEVIIADEEYLPLLQSYRAAKPGVPIIVDTDTDVTAGQITGPFDSAVFEGLKYDSDNGGKGWDALESQAASEDDVIALAYTSGTTARPKGVEFTHRGCYLAAMANIVESGLNFDERRCHYLWTLPMFHAMGEYTYFRSSSVLSNTSQDGPSHGRLRQSAEHTTACGRLTTPRFGGF